MAEYKVCRICLLTEAKMFHLDRYNLNYYYEEITGINVNDNDALPQYFCYECAALLHKLHEFREKCYRGLNVLKETLLNGSITRESIANINRETTKLKSTLEIIILSNDTFYKNSVPDNSDSDSLDSKPYIKTVKHPVIQEIHLISQSNDSLYNKNLVKYEIEIDECMDDDNDKISNCEKTECESESENIINGNTDVKNEKVINKEITKINKNNIKNNKGNKRNANNKNLSKKNAAKKKKKNESASKDVLDPQNWLTINLTEEEALEDFKARAQDGKFLSAAYKCYKCCKGFSKEDMLNRHNNLRHNESLGPVECRFCHMRFKWKCFLRSHLPQHYTKYKCLRCNLMCPLKTTAIFHNEYHNGVIRKCEHCGEEFRHSSTYYTHLRTHRSEHVCTLCGASFVSDVGLRQHRRTMHVNATVNTGEEMTYCKRCDVRFETLAAYEAHVFHSAKHDEMITDTSTETDKVVEKSKKGNRRPRLRTNCDICNKDFKTNTAYLKHRSEKHKDSLERQICEICGMSLLPSSIPTHMNTHTKKIRFPCGLCSMNFSTKISMKRHQLTHTGEKPHGCTLCEKRFTQRGSMLLHYRTFHLKEPYPKRIRWRKITIDTPSVEGHIQK